MATKRFFFEKLMALLLALSASIAQADIIELHVTASWSASDFDVSSTLFGDDNTVFGVAPSNGSTSFTLLVDTSSMVSINVGEFGVTHDWFGYSDVTLARTHTFGSANWETGDITARLVGPNGLVAALWTNTDISIAAPSLMSFRMIGDWPGGNADLFVGPRSATTISTRFSMSEYYEGENISRASNAITTAVTSPEPSAPESGVYGGIEFPRGPVSFADKVEYYDPGFGGGPEPDVTQQDARQILGVPKQGSVSLGNGGQVVVRFMDNKLVPSGDSRPDLYVFEVGGPETTLVEIKRNRGPWYSVGTATGYAAGIDIDAFGFGRGDAFLHVRLTDDGDSYGDDFTPGADLVAVGARTTVRSYEQEQWLTYWIQAHVGGKSQLILRNNTLSWHHFKGTAPGQTRASSGFASGSNSPTIIDSSQGPNIEWVHSDWPERLGNGTHPEAWAQFEALTPVFPQKEWCWQVEKRVGVGHVSINEQPNSRNGYALKIMFNDLGSGNKEHLSGSGFYSIELKPMPGPC